jgi:cyclase
VKPLIDRRAVLTAALGVAVQGMFAPVAAAAARRPGAQRLALTDNLSLIGGVGTNVLALASPAGSLLVDTGSAEGRAALRAQLAGLPGKGRVLTVINTHWHREQSGNNEMFGKSGAAIIAHQKTRQRLSNDLWQPESQQYLHALPKAGWPTRAFYQNETLEFAGERVECGYLLEAHTDGDIYVRLRNANVLAVGDVLAAKGSDPVLDWFGGGWIGGRIDALAALLKLSDAETRVVPAQGPVVSRNELQTEHDMLSGLFERLTVMMRKGFTTDDMIASNVLDTTGRSWNDGAKFLYTVHKGLWAHHNTISHDIV